MTQQAVNFLPEDYVERRAQQRTAVVFVGLFVVVMVGVGVAYLVPERQLMAEGAVRDQINVQLEAKARQAAQIQELEQEKARMIMKAEVTASLRERVARSVLLREFTKLRPAGVSMLSLELKTKQDGARRTGSKLDEARAAQGGALAAGRPAVAEVELSLTGVAPTDGEVANYISALGKSALLRDVNLLYSEEYKHGEDTMRRFRVDMRLNPEADTWVGKSE